MVVRKPIIYGFGNHKSIIPQSKQIIGLPTRKVHPMPKIKYQPPKYCKIKIRKKQYAAVYLNGKTIYLGAYGSPESKTAYARFVAGLKVGTAPYLPENKGSVTVQALVLSFLDHVKGTITPQSYGHHRSAVQTLLNLYGDDTFVGSFTPRCLKLFRQELINSKRLCRNMVNEHTRRIVSMFTWGVEEELVQPHTEHKFGGGSVYGICNHPDAITTTFTNPWTTAGTRNPAWKPGVMQREILALRHQLYDIHRYGPFNIYHSPDFDVILDDDFNDTTSGLSSSMTLRERLGWSLRKCNERCSCV